MITRIITDSILPGHIRFSHTKCVNTAKSDWVMNGFTDADWDQFQNDLKAYGLDRYLEIHQKYLDAYFAG